MRGIVALVAVVGLAGCDALFGLTTLEHDARPDAVDPLRVGGRQHVRHTVNQSDFTPALVDDVHPSQDIKLDVQLDDGSTPVVDYADGVFSFPLTTAGQSYRLTVATPFGKAEYQSAANHLELADRFGGRLFPDPVTMPTTIQVRLGSSQGAVWLVSTGVWTQTYANQMNTATFDFDWATAAPASWRGLLRADRNDRLYVVDTAGYPQITPVYNAISSYGTYSITQTDGATTTISAPPVAAVTHDRCTRLLALGGDGYTRLHAAQPTFPVPAYGWGILALPAYELENAGEISIAFGGGPPTTTSLDMMYVNPYVGTKLAAVMDVVSQRTIQLPGTTSGTTINGGGRTLQKIASASCSSTVVVQSTVGIAGVPSLDNNPLDADNQPLTLDPTRDPVVTWNLAADGPVDYSVVALFELVNNAGATALSVQYGVITARSSATFRRALFVSGHTYLFHITNVLGAPNAAAGDFDTLTYPYEKLATLSASFTVN